MKLYNKILLAVDLEHIDEDDRVVRKAMELAQKFDVKLNAIYVIEHMKGYDALYYQINFDVEKALLEEAQEKMDAFCQKYNFPKEDQVIKMGVTKLSILEQARTLQADLIVLGSHGRHGVQLLLGSTANAVLHGAQCDVLIVHLKDAS
jgi:universal stress protein A